MIIVLQILFWVSIVALFHTYIGYPIHVSWLAKNKLANSVFYTKENLPKIAVVVAAYNEEKVIVEKIQSILSSNYPAELVDIFIGSDCSSDATVELSKSFNNNNIRVVDFKNRSGKSGVLNQLFAEYVNPEKYEIVVLTDANVVLDKSCVTELVKHFCNDKIGVVCAYVKNKLNENEEVNKQEARYISSENTLKVNEGKAFKAAIGAFGACYAIRTKVIKPIPANFLMEDFFLSMNSLLLGFQNIAEENALAYEDLPGSISEEFKRKRRISAGNFQNLNYFKSLLFTKNLKLSYAFISHKVLRWLGPIFLALIAICNIFLAFHFGFYSFYYGSLVVGLGFVLLAYTDYVMNALNIHVNLIRLLRYFLIMNLALFFGFIDYVKGIKSNVWQPTQRK